MYALVDISGKQYKAMKGALLKTDRIDKDEGEILELSTVLLLSDGDAIKVGKPYIRGAKVRAIVEGHGKDKKVIVYKYKKRKGYRKKQGHRQNFTLLRVQGIDEKTKKEPKADGKG
jgi:large subunit ribosomal protein L21